MPSFTSSKALCCRGIIELAAAPSKPPRSCAIWSRGSNAVFTKKHGYDQNEGTNTLCCPCTKNAATCSGSSKAHERNGRWNKLESNWESQEKAKTPWIGSNYKNDVWMVNKGRNTKAMSVLRDQRRISTPPISNMYNKSMGDTIIELIAYWQNWNYGKRWNTIISIQWIHWAGLPSSDKSYLPRHQTIELSSGQYTATWSDRPPIKTRRTRSAKRVYR